MAIGICFCSSQNGRYLCMIGVQRHCTVIVKVTEETTPTKYVAIHTPSDGGQIVSRERHTVGGNAHWGTRDVIHRSYCGCYPKSQGSVELYEYDNENKHIALWHSIRYDCRNNLCKHVLSNYLLIS